MADCDFDDILILLKTGKWNMLYFIGVSSCAFWLPAVILAGTFVAPNVNHTCDPPHDNDFNITHVGACLYTTEDSVGNSTEHQCHSWVYNVSETSNSLTTEFNLVCDRAYLRPTYQTAYMVGNIIGSPIIGVLSDRFGRKSVISATVLFGIASLLVSLLLHKIFWILFARFLMGFCFHPMLLSAFSLFMEVCEPKHRSVAGIYYSLPWAFGTIWWGCLGYLIDDWRWLQAASILPSSIILICLILYDESPRWLIINGHHQRALSTILKAARWNRCMNLPSDEELFTMMAHIQKTALERSRNTESSSSNPRVFFFSKVKKTLSLVFVLFRTPEIRKITFLMYLTFFVSGFVYYGMSLNAGNFNLNPYMYMVVVGVTMIPAYTLTGNIIGKFGRVKPTVISFIICSICSFFLSYLSLEGALPWLKSKWLLISVVFVGYLCIAAAFQIIFLAGTEVFPTEVRLQGFGTSSFLSSVGGGVAPYITDLLGAVHAWIPSIFFGSLSIVAGIAAIFIPETLDRHLPETIEELEENKRNRRNTPSVNV